MTTQQIVRYQDSATHADIELSIAEIKRTICPTATDVEAHMFLELCRHQGLNPFTRDVYLVKYSGRPATHIIGKEGFTKRAEAHQNYDGMTAGIVVLRSDGEMVDRVGTIKLENETLVGGWAKVYRTDRKIPSEVTVQFAEFNTGQAQWKTMPATMIRKCALVSALREAFPSTFAGLYDSSEMGVDLENTTQIIPSVRGEIISEGSVELPPPPTISNGASSNQEVASAHGIDPTLIEDMGIPENALIDAVQTTVDDIVADTQRLIAEKTIPTTDADSGIVDLHEPEKADVPPPCETHGNTPYQLVKNEETGQSRYIHEVFSTVNGERVRSWCVYSEPVSA